MRDKETQHDNSNDGEKNDLQDRQRTAFADITAFVTKAASWKRTITNRGSNGFHPGRNTAAGIARPDLRSVDFSNDARRRDIRHRTFQSISHFESKFAIV